MEAFINNIEALAKKNGHGVGRKIEEAIYEAAPQIVTLHPNNPVTHLAVTNCVKLLRQSIHVTSDYNRNG